jgi:nitrite reductase/ring-hydroxylating ferredoxin subunit
VAHHREDGGHQSLSSLCRLDDIPEPGGRGFRIGHGSETRALFVVRKGGRVFAYENSCPHTGSPLDWVPDRFLDLEKRHILCATHGALFRIADGYCLAGPCAGKSLKSVSITVTSGCVCFNPDSAA